MNLDICHPQWHEIIQNALATMDAEYLNHLANNPHWLPGPEKLFSAFTLPLSATRYVLLGESPYPRQESANGYAFWDNAVDGLWSTTGLSKPVNKATSLRNWLKMLLIARGDVTTDTSQQAIAQVDKSSLVQTAAEFFTGMMNKGILLLNASLVFSEGKVPYHARHWQPFMQSLLSQLTHVELILFGSIAKTISADNLKIGLVTEHPYNVSFITNESAINFFKPLDLLSHVKN